MVRMELLAMGNTNLQYYVTSSQPERIIELRDELARATDPEALLAGAYAQGKVWGVDFWVATAIEHPCYYVWCHSRLPLTEDALEAQVSDLNHQAGLARSTYVELPVAVLQPQAIVAVEQDGVAPLATGPTQHHDFHVWSAQVPVALVRVGCWQPETQVDWNGLQRYVQLVGLHLSAILSRPDGVEAIEIVGNGENLDQETFFQCVELALAQVHRRAGELSLLAMEIKPRDPETAILVSTEDWHQVREQIRGELRRSDLVGEIAPGYYVVAMPLTDAHDALIAADRIRKKLGQMGNQGAVPLCADMGVSTWSAGRPGIGQLLWEAREAMHLAASSCSDSAFIYA